MGKRDKLSPCIYCIQNTINEKRYIGSATRTKERWRGHRSLLRRNIHFSTHLQSAWNKYGEDKFNFFVIEEINSEELLADTEKLLKKLTEREEYWIEYYKTTNNLYGYNSRTDCDTNLGLKWSEESKRKFSEKKKGIVPEHLIEAVRQAWKDPEFRAKHAAIMKEYRDNLTDEEKQEIAKKRSNSLKDFYEKQLAEKGYKQDPKIVENNIQKGLESGRYKSVYVYLPNGKFFKEFRTQSEFLRFMNLSPKNGGCLSLVVDKYFFKGLILSYTKYDKIPRKMLQLITNSSSRCNCILFDKQENKKYLFCTIKELTNFLGISHSKLNKTNLEKSCSDKRYKVQILAPIIGNDSSKVCEFIESLYNKDNNEPSSSLNG